MPNVVAVRFRYNPHQLWFDPAGNTPVEGDHVIVSTERGTEIGLAVSDVFEESEEQIASICGKGLKPVLRVASEDDLALAEELAAKGEAAMPYFNELALKYRLDMKPVCVEYLFGGEKAVFYFVSEERIDFREMVRDLAARFHIRIDMRQIGVRDEARLVGGISHCGQELCCARLGGEFQPVSIRMAKEQDLPLNPSKISGVCGRLLCCLRYEFEAYSDFKSRAPKRGALIQTPLGLAKVVEFDTPREQLMLRLEDGKSFSVPLASMECDPKRCAEGNSRPCIVSREALEDNPSSTVQLALAALEREEERTSLAEEAAASTRQPRQRSGKHAFEEDVRVPNFGSSATSNKNSGDAASNRDKRRRGRAEQKQQSEPSAPAAPERKLRRRSVVLPSEQSPAADSASSKSGDKPSNRQGNAKRSASSGRHSAENRPNERQNERQGERRNDRKNERSDKRDASNRQQSQQAQQGQQTSKPRPGQASSGIRNPRNADAGTGSEGNGSYARRRRHRSSASSQSE